MLESPDNYDVRKELAIAQFMAGMSFTNVGLGIVHSMAHPLSAFYDVPHGIANALILPYIVKFRRRRMPGQNDRACTYNGQKFRQNIRL